MACRGSGVRIPLAPFYFFLVIQISYNLFNDKLLMKKSEILIVFVALASYFFLINLNLESVDIAYPKVFQSSDNFYSFFRAGGGNSVTLWLYYFFSNLLGLNYEIARFFISVIYIYTSIKLAFLLKSKLKQNISNYILICYPLFFIFGQFGLALILSAERMLFGMLFMQRAMISSIKEKYRFKYIFYFLSILTHYSFIIFVFLIEFPGIYITLKNTLIKLFSLKLKKNVIYLLFAPLFPLLYSFFYILNKISRLISPPFEFENSYILLIVANFIIFFILQKNTSFITRVLGFSFFLLPLMTGVGSGRIAWLYSFASLYYFFVNPFSLQKNSKKIIYYSYLILLTLYYIYKSYVRITLGALEI